LDYELNASSLTVLASEGVIETVQSRADFVAGKYGTIISLGCYSECWDEPVRHSTLELIAHFLKKGNPVQFATKRHVEFEDIEKVTELISWKGQLSIFVSSVSLSLWNSLERGTEDPAVRFETFRLTLTLDIPVYLYIKPVIESVTIRDLAGYIELVRKKKIVGVVVGSKFIKGDNVNSKLAPISNGELRYSKKNSDEEHIYRAFSKEVKTFNESIQAIEYWRSNA